MSQITRVECPDCGWCNEANDPGWVLHSAIVHNTRLKKGHNAAQVEVIHTGQHPKHWHCLECTTFRRRAVILHRALHNPDGLPPHKYTSGMTKANALQFWVDAKALGLIVVGKTTRGAKLLALKSVAEKTAS